MNDEIRLSDELEKVVAEITSILIGAYPNTPPLIHMSVVMAIIGIFGKYTTKENTQ